MKTTISLSSELLAQIKVFCIAEDIKTQEFVEYICIENQKFSDYIKKAKQLNL